MQSTLIDTFLEEQARLTAVDRFAQAHATMDEADVQAGYTSLIPKTGPGPGQQYAFKVDLDKCTGCKACVTGCHNENGLDVDETWRSVGVVQGGPAHQPAIQHITTACHHCLEPACSAGCPVKAYEKDEVTGIVRHLDDQCIGCQYCILKCPYDVPKYSKKRGIVHKCDMCIGRLEVGQAPACVRACPTQSISIQVVDQAQVKAGADTYVDVPDSPSSQYTFPTTQYTRKKPLPSGMESADYYALKPEHSHMPLVVMLVLTQLSVGAFLTLLLVGRLMESQLAQDLLPVQALVALGVGFLALSASIFHLGRPWLAFRAILGVMTSWLSREILAFGAFSGLATLYALSFWVPFIEVQVHVDGASLAWLGHGVGALVVFFGIVGIWCSVMVYKDTRRPFWDSPLTTFKFFMTMGLLGMATILWASLVFAAWSVEISWGQVMAAFGNALCLALGLLTLLKLALESSIFLVRDQGELTVIKKTAVLMWQHLRPYTVMRFACGFFGGVVLPFFLLDINQGVSAMLMVSVATVLWGAVLVGELLERYLFFRAVVPLKMPGGVAA